MSRRAELVADLSQHLSAEITKLIIRHGTLAQVVGCSPSEMSAMMMLTTESVARQAIGMTLLAAAPSRRDAMYPEIVSRLACSLNNDQQRVMRAVNSEELA